MTNQQFYNLMKETFQACEAVAKSKGEDYTKGSLDALANFKEGGKDVNVEPLKVAWIFMNKHYQAITNYIKTGGQSESEPIDGRITDMINYLVLVKGLIVEGRIPAINFEPAVKFDPCRDKSGLAIAECKEEDYKIISEEFEGDILPEAPAPSRYPRKK